MSLEDKKPIFGATQNFIARRCHTTEANLHNWLNQETQTEAVHISPCRVFSMPLFVLLLEFNPYQRRVAVTLLGIDAGSLG